MGLMSNCMSCDEPDPCKSCGGCRACGCGPCCNECTPRTRRIIPIKYTIHTDAAATCFPAACCEFPRGADISNLSAWVRPRGTSTWLLTYVAFDRDDEGRVCFRWDSQLFGLGKDRLEVEFRRSNGLLPPTYFICGRVELRIRDNCAISLGSAVTIPFTDPPPVATETLPGVTPVFDDLLGYSGQLCAILEPSGTTLQLCPADLTALCSISPLCRPAQLQISDGVNIEYVSFSGCVASVINVVRAQSGTTARRFPVGSTVSFVWTAANVEAAVEGCP